MVGFVEKWYTLYPRGYEGGDLKKEMENSLRCTNCMPACSDTLYSVDIDYGQIANPKWVPQKKNWQTSIIFFCRNISIIHIFFQESTGDLLKQDVLYYWFDIISKKRKKNNITLFEAHLLFVLGLFGGTFSVVVGISLITLVEFFYFFTYRLYQLRQKRRF